MHAYENLARRRPGQSSQRSAGRAVLAAYFDTLVQRCRAALPELAAPGSTSSEGSCALAANDSCVRRPSFLLEAGVSKLPEAVHAVRLLCRFAALGFATGR